MHACTPLAASYEDIQLNISHAVALRIKENHTVRQESCPVLNLGMVLIVHGFSLSGIHLMF